LVESRVGREEGRGGGRMHEEEGREGGLGRRQER